MNALIYDCEIINAIPSRDGVLEEGITYCAGWHDYASMGISVIGAFDYASYRYRVFCRDNFGEFEALARSSAVLVGFNNLGFDDKLIAASGLILPAPDAVPRYDLLAETWAAVGLARQFSSEDHKGYGLDALCMATFGQGKTGNGALAPIDWQRGNKGNVIDYCLADVWLTKRLFDYVLGACPLINPRTKMPFLLQLPLGAVHEQSNGR